MDKESGETYEPTEREKTTGVIECWRNKNHVLVGKEEEGALVRSRIAEIEKKLNKTTLIKAPKRPMKKLDDGRNKKIDDFFKPRQTL